MSRDIADLHPLLRDICRQHLARLRENDIPVVLSFTYRSYLEQDRLWRLGRDENGKIVFPKEVVTYAKAGQSWHNVERGGIPASLAYDLFLHEQGKALPADHVNWTIAGRIGESLGLSWGVLRRNGERWDLGHFQLDSGRTLSLDLAMKGEDPRVVLPE